MFLSESPLTILKNGHIYLFDDGFSQVEGLAISNDCILAAGLDKDIQSLQTSTSSVINLEGRTIIPGLIDAHVHIQAMAKQRSMVDCETETIEECLQRIRSRADTTPANSWIQGRGWDQNLWGRYGNKEDLDSITNQHPTYLIAKSGHAAWVNSMALALADTTDLSRSIERSDVQIGKDHKPTGVLFENAMKLVSSQLPQMTRDELVQAINNVQDHLLRVGLTGFHDFDGPNAFMAMQHLHGEMKLGLRVVKNIPIDQLENVIEVGLQTGFGNNWLRIGNIKIFVDGALGPQTAAMLEPYEGKSDDRGILLLQVEELTKTIKHAVQHGFGVSIHAIGDRANHVVLDAFENVRREEISGTLPHFRHRIEHLQLLHPDDLHRPAALNIIASMQPLHATSDMIMADKHWGNRSRYSYAWKSELDAGTKLIFGSDAPIESPNPFLGLHAAVTRRRLDGSPGEEGWIPEEKIKLYEAFMAYTRGPAFAAGLEKEQGCLLPGFWADLIVLDEDPFACSSEQLPYLTPVGTMVAGEWKYRDF
jgi:predicted amidohydrolase YtcJ